MIIDKFTDKWEPLTYPVSPNTTPVFPYFPYAPAFPPIPPVSPITPEEIEEFRRLLKKAREQDIAEGNPDCEMESKKDALRRIAKALGVELPTEF